MLSKIAHIDTVYWRLQKLKGLRVLVIQVGQSAGIHRKRATGIHRNSKRLKKPNGGVITVNTQAGLELVLL